MKSRECEHETAVLEAWQAGRWPHACGEELRAHVAGCAACAEAVRVAQLLREEEARLLGQAHLPAPGLVWWKAQMRARRAAAARAAAPIALVERLAAACGVLSLVGLAVWQWWRVESWWDWFRVLPYQDILWPAGAAAFWSPNLVLVLSVLLCLALVSFLLFVVLAEE